MILLEDIQKVTFSRSDGYTISFLNTANIIKLSKRRTLVGLLLLIKYHICSEEDLTGTNKRLSEIKHIMTGKMDISIIQDRYGDANKPFSELWTEEMFSFIRAEGFKGNRKYVLDETDHEKLFCSIDKSVRSTISSSIENIILEKQQFKCNICGSILKRRKDITYKIFAKDRVTLEIDHRIPIDRGGISEISNYQALCHYCNKCKRQMCYNCDQKNCNSLCALVNPEEHDIVIATNENISDRKG